MLITSTYTTSCGIMSKNRSSDTYGHSEVGLEFPEGHVHLETGQVNFLSKVSEIECQTQWKHKYGWNVYLLMSTVLIIHVHKFSNVQ